MLYFSGIRIRTISYMKDKTVWQWEISPNRPWYRLNLKELIQYKDLLLRFVRRDILASYQQTLLGPIWVFLQPLFTTFVYFIIFSRVAKIPTDGIPPFLFYLPGSIIWSYYADCVATTMNITFSVQCIYLQQGLFPEDYRTSEYDFVPFLSHFNSIVAFHRRIYFLFPTWNRPSIQLANTPSPLHDRDSGLFCTGLWIDRECTDRQIPGSRQHHAFFASTIYVRSAGCLSRLSDSAEIQIYLLA